MLKGLVYRAWNSCFCAEASEPQLVVGNLITQAANILNIAGSEVSVESAAENLTVYSDGLTLNNDNGNDQMAHDNVDQAYAQWQADLDTETAIAAAYNVAEQAATSDAITAKQDQAVAQADSALVQAASAASSQASAQTQASAQASAAEATATAQPLTVNGGPLTITGEAPSGSNVTNLTVSAPITMGYMGYSISNIAANGNLWTVTTTAASGLATSDSVTISGVTPTEYDGTWTVASASTTTAPYTFTIASTINPGPAGYGGTAAAVVAGINFNGNGSPITVSANITAPGAVDLAEPETASGGDDLSVSPGATVASENSSVALAAGDNIAISSGATIQASFTIAITADSNDATYQGQVTFNATADTLILPAGGPAWTSLGVAPGGYITVAGSANNNGDFTIATGGISTDGYTLTLSNITPETDSGVTVKDGPNGTKGAYQGQVTFAANTSGDTLTLPVSTGTTWTSLGFAAGDAITVSGSPSNTNNGSFIIASAAGQTLTLTDRSLTSEKDLAVTVGATYGASDGGNNVTVANVTIAGTLSAPSALINVPPESTRPVTFNITPSLTTPITVAGSGQGTDTLNVNLNTAGLAVTISETQTTTGTHTLSSGTITAAGMQTVTFTNIAAVNFTDAAGGASVTLNGNSQATNTMSLVGSGQGAGTVTLDNAPLSFSGAASLNYQGGIGDTISVTPYATALLGWNLAVTVAGGAGAPASLTYNSVDAPADTVTATGADAGVIGSPGLATVQFSNVGTVTANAGQSPGDQLTVNLRGTATANLQSAAPNSAAIALQGFFTLNTAAYANLTLSDTTGTAQFVVGEAAALEATPTGSLNLQVVGSPFYSDQLLVTDAGGEPAGTSDTINPSFVPGSGSVTVGALNPVTYQNVQNVKFLPAVTVADPGGTYNGQTFAATAQVEGGASLGGITPTLAYYTYSGGTFTPTVNYITGTFTLPTGAVQLSGAPANAGTYAVVATFTGNGTIASNWAWTTFTVTPATLTVSIINTPAKTYDGTTTATLSSSNFALTGLIGTQSFTVTQTTGTYNGKDVSTLSANSGTAPGTTVTASLSASNFTAGSGTLASNYVLPTTATGAGTITPKSLTAAIIGTPTRVYDGTTNATLTSASYSLTGLVSGQGFTIAQTAGSYISKDVAAATTVTATLTAGNFTPVGSTLAGDYTLPTTATGAGTITPKSLTATIIGTPTKVYDGTTNATLTSASYSIAGLVGSDGFTITQTAGSYISKNAASATTVTATLTAGNFTAVGSTLAGDYALPTTATGNGTITPKTLTASIIGTPTKVYDGTTNATLTSANYSLTGLVTGEGFTVTQAAGSYNSNAVASATTVTATLTAGNFTAVGSTLAGNYVLPTSATAPAPSRPGR